MRSILLQRLGRRFHVRGLSTQCDRGVLIHSRRPVVHMNLGVSQTIAGVILDIPYGRIDLPFDSCGDPFNTRGRHIGVACQNLCRLLLKQSTRN